MAWVADGLVIKPYLREQGEIRDESTSGSLKYEDVFPDELPRFPP